MHDLKEILGQALDQMPPAADPDPGPDLMRGRTLVRRRRRFRVSGATVVCAVAAVLVVTLTGGTAGTRQRPPAAASAGRTGTGTGTGTVTAAMVRHIAGASRSALAYSGRALVSYADSGTAVQPSYGTEAIAFSGSNWNDVLTDYLVHPDAGVRNPDYAINRIVNGKVYSYFMRGLSDSGFWVHDTNPGEVQAVHIPDPRTLLTALQPDAGFTVVGFQVTGGIQLERLRASRLGALAGFSDSLAWALRGEHLTGLSLWVDRSGVVHRMAVSLSGRNLTGESLATSLTITFTGIGQPQVITTPSSFTTISGRD